MRYAAFLRGVNVGGRKAIMMDALRAAFEGLGFANVRTIQVSGNVVFDVGGEEAPARGNDEFARGETQAPVLASRIEKGLEKTFGYPFGVILRSLADVRCLVESDPFHGVVVDRDTRLYVTFLSRPAENTLQIRPDARAQVVAVTAAEVLTVITLSPGWGTSELMAWLEKRFGKDVTTRNWNTIVKIAAA